VGGFLIVKADGEMRVTKKPVRLALNEVAFPLSVTIPLLWGRVQPTRIEVSLPEPPGALVVLGDPLLNDSSEETK
jgi:hypothetical protein